MICTEEVCVDHGGLRRLQPGQPGLVGTAAAPGASQLVWQGLEA